ncbi:hypothetical protein Esi_1084_0002 [Ectocarpus siliculosus]|uniref:Uncharacterized protein n=1 Tax=Ectocarpus siliculosus TaxID=2880 RepID=D7FHJ8_ECTSI|nr:hypothetical protein Esi_1084_0002 [Ectocarpus siliculosus]|eukprot:CBJ34134.1 hypothetical protein Esi_1084_0002 [Ectocarpus siliculosus]
MIDGRLHADRLWRIVSSRVQEEEQRPGTNKSTGPSTLQAATARSPHLGGEDSGPPPLRSGDDPAAEEAPNRAREIVMDPTLPRLLPRTAPHAPDHNAAQQSTRNRLSKGSGITSQHIRWVTELRSARGRWSSEVQGPWTQTEDAYFEFVYELFREGLLEGIEVGLPLRFFMSELLGWVEKLLADLPPHGVRPSEPAGRQ